ncbi:MAG TPA: winged helix-turn-helix domain-containing protein [Rhizomicrobium sp.]|jgi:DNA-binding winged helix-turn-helix (wHTH) protein|nr:winged helix-turn-helix domain-containing protein [Rhizomicrobium sp.]
MASEGSVKNWIISFGPFRVIRPRRIIERDGETVHIGGRAFDVLAYLLEHAGQVVSRRALFEAVWPGTYVEEGNLRFQVAMLRKALGNSHTSYIINVPGRGYCFTAPISKLDEAEPPPAPRRISRIANVVVPRGMGKTLVAIAPADQLRQKFGDRVCFIEFGRIEDLTRVRNARAVARGLPMRSVDPFSDIVGSLKDCRMLILMDGCEHVIATSAALLELLKRQSNS